MTKFNLILILLLCFCGCGRYENSQVKQTTATVNIKHYPKHTDYTYDVDYNGQMSWHWEDVPEKWVATFVCDGFSIEENQREPFRCKEGLVRLKYREVYWVSNDGKVRELRYRQFVDYENEKR
jgi:hypothetical protein